MEMFSFQWHVFARMSRSSINTFDSLFNYVIISYRLYSTHDIQVVVVEKPEDMRFRHRVYTTECRLGFYLRNTDVHRAYDVSFKNTEGMLCILPRIPSTTPLL